jgi:hypothetical protein
MPAMAREAYPFTGRVSRQWVVRFRTSSAFFVFRTAGLQARSRTCASLDYRYSPKAKIGLAGAALRFAAALTPPALALASAYSIFTSML